MSPPTRRKSSLLTGTEERKRGQRLFGNLLGTLSQTSSKPTHKKRDEIEKRQVERMKREKEDREREKRERKEELARVRGKEKDVWERESREVQLRNRRAQAGFLRTETEPVLFWRPWELREEERVRIRRQVEAVEGEFETKGGKNGASAWRKLLIHRGFRGEGQG